MFIVRLAAKFILSASALFTFQEHSFGQEVLKEYWYPYLADYDGKPGSIIVDMVWFKKAERHDLPYSFKITLNCQNKTDDGLPWPSELSRLDSILDYVYQAISQKTKIVQVGLFAFQNQRSAYHYVNDTAQTQKVTREVFRKKYPNITYGLVIRVDEQWKAYFEFLYPNKETIRFYEEKDGLKPLFHH